VGRLPQLIHSLLFQGGFVDQAALYVGVIIGSIKRLLESPVFQFRRQSRFFHSLELSQSYINAGITDQRAFPIALQSQKPLSEVLRVTFSDEVTGVFAENVDYVLVWVPT